MKNTHVKCRDAPTPAGSSSSETLGPHLCGSSHPDTHVRSSVVIEFHDAADELSCLPRALGTLHAVEPLLLDDAVDALGQGIIRGTVVLRHADSDSQPVKTRNIFIAAVLHAAVGVVDERLPVSIGSCLRDGLFQRRLRVAGLESFRERPPDDLTGVGIGNQVQVADSILRHDVRDVGNPQLVGSRRAEARLQEVPVLAVVVVGVRRVSSVQRFENQMFDVHQVVEAVATDCNARTHVLDHQP